MSYPVMSSRRMPYDIDGTQIAYESGMTNCMQSWISEASKAALNVTQGVNTVITQSNIFATLFFFFPERREIEAAFVSGTSEANISSVYVVSMEGSNDTTNGQDGTWETANFPSGNPATHNPIDTSWRLGVKPVSFSTSYKTLRIKFGHGATFGKSYFSRVHLYGRVAAAARPDDILITDIAGTELTALMDFGDQPEGTTEIQSIRLKNLSTTKTANNVNIQLNDADFLLSTSESGPWTATLDITSIASGSLSAAIFIKNELDPPLLVLGPRAARTIVTVGSWT